MIKVKSEIKNQQPLEMKKDNNVSFAQKRQTQK